MQKKTIILLLMILLIKIMVVPRVILAAEQDIWELKLEYRGKVDYRTEIFDIQTEIKEDEIIISGEVITMDDLSDFISELEQRLPGYEIKNNASKITGDFGLVANDVVDLLDAPEEKEDVVSQLIFAEPVHILEEDGGWLHVQGQDMYLGWVRKDYIEEISSAEFKRWRSGEFFTVTATSSTLYQSPDPPASTVNGKLNIPHGTRLKAGEIKEGFVRIYFPGEDNLWISEKDVKHHPLDTAVTRENIINTAEKYLGTPYLWGGTSIKGIDCSGFIQRVLSANGIFYPRDSDQQYQFSEKIDPEELKIGDIIFFSTYREGPSHMGFYIGNDLFIHASGQQEKVLMNSLDPNSDKYSAYYDNRYYGSTRLRKNNDFLASWMKPENDDKYF